MPLPPFDLAETAPAGMIDVFARREITRRSYAELYADVRHVQARLVLAGLKRGDVVGLLGGNCYEWLVCDLALLAMACIPVAFPESLAGSDLDELAERYELSLLLVTRRYAKASRSWIDIIDEAGPQPTVRQAQPGEICSVASQSDLCAVIFSSGSSGELKPIALSRQGVEAVFDSFVEGFGVTADDRIFVALPLSIFQQRVLAYAALRAGATICLADPPTLFHALSALSPSIVLAPPSLFEAIEDRDYGPEPLMTAFGGKPRLLLTGSAPSRLSTLCYFEQAGFPIFQIYGMAEIGFIAWNRPGANRPGTVGQAVQPGSIAIADDGEVIVSVPRRQAIGYLGAAKAGQDEVFLLDGRVATGDLGRFDAAGNLCIEGRKKDLIVTRSGRKFAVRPIEEALEAVRGVARAVVIGGGDLPWPVAIVVAEVDLSETCQREAWAAVEAAIAEINQSAEPEQRIARTIWSDVPFSAENGLLTRNLKVDRNAIARKFAGDIMGQVE
jgi:long-chain acyl-CoA synthetase